MRTARRVLQVLGRSAGGIAAHVNDIAEGLQGRDGIEMSFAAPPDMRARLATPFFPLAIPDGLWGHRSAVSELRMLASRGDFHVVHAHGLRASLDSGRGARGKGPLTLATVHNLVLPELMGSMRARALSPLESLAVRWNDRVFAPSADIARRLRETVPDQRGKVEVLHLGVSTMVPERATSTVRSELGLGPSDHLVVTVARLAPQKALNVLLRAHALLPQETHLAIAGSGPLEHELKNLATDLGSSERVHFLGYIAHPRWLAYRGADDASYLPRD